VLVKLHGASINYRDLLIPQVHPTPILPHLNPSLTHRHRGNTSSPSASPS
jgi:hypothetical protein